MSKHFKIDDPGLACRLTTRIERGARPVRYIFRYNSGAKVECAFCDNHTLHNRGFLVEMEDGRIALCGRDCARDFFGEEVAARFDEDLKRREQRQKVESFLAPVLAGVEPAIANLERWLDLEREIDAAASSLAMAIGLDLRPVVTTAGTIERIREEFIEAKEMGRDGKSRTVRHVKRTLLGRVRGVIVLTGRSGLLDRAIGKLRIIQAKGQSDTTKLTDNMLSYLQRIRTDAFGLIKDGVERIEAAKVFFAPQNIEQLGLWSRDRQTRVEIRWISPITGQAISVRCRRRHRPAEIAIPVIVQTPALDDLLAPLRR